MGTALRTRYNFFLNQSYHYTLIEGISSDYIRTKESLQLVLAGLFPPTKELTWNPEINWIPIATYYNEIENDKVINYLFIIYYISISLSKVWELLCCLKNIKRFSLKNSLYSHFHLPRDHLQEINCYLILLCACVWVRLCEYYDAGRCPRV